MEVNQKVSLNPVTLSFKGQYSFLEDVFRKEFFPGSLKRIRMVLLFGILAYDLFGILDSLIVPEHRRFFWMLRYLVFTPYAVGTYLFTYTKVFRGVVQLAYFLLEAVAGVIIIIMIVAASSVAGTYYYAGLILIFMLAYSAMDMRFVCATAAGWLIVVLYEFAVFMFTDMSYMVFISNNFFFIGANIIGMFAAYNIEAAKRRNFFHLYLLERERETVKDYSDNLESKVLERTFQLEHKNMKLREEVEAREKIEKEMNGLLLEKEILLKELYHRTKNSLQMVSSMLSLEILHNDDMRLDEILRKTELKIYSMEVVHQKLFESGNLSSLNLKDYLYDVAVYVAQSCSGEGVPVDIDFDMDDIFSPINTAVTCGIIVTELVVNSVRSFCGDSAGHSELTVSLKKLESDKVELVVSGRGCGGEAADSDDPMKNLGLRTVYELGRYQLDGEVSFSGISGGISCRVLFTNTK